MEPREVRWTWLGLKRHSWRSAPTGCVPPWGVLEGVMLDSFVPDALRPAAEAAFREGRLGYLLTDARRRVDGAVPAPVLGEWSGGGRWILTEDPLLHRGGVRVFLAEGAGSQGARADLSFWGQIRILAEVDPEQAICWRVKVAAMRPSLRGADLCGAGLSRADLRGADLCGARLRGADLRNADLHRVNLEGADLRGADLCGVNLTNADLFGAYLREVMLICGNIEGANLYSCCLRGADLRRCDMRLVNLTGADLRGANLLGADLRGANLTGAILTDANLTDANLSGANLSNVDLGGARLTFADLKGSSLRFSHLQRATFRRADLHGADLTGANLADADLTDALVGWECGPDGFAREVAR
jgi:uncharacterized protein YjbI with pentapeptide repeats